nr:hypothetical protein [Planctomycetota bacterium]
ADRTTALARLRALGIVPPGVVFTDWTSGEAAGGLALAAGRFQGLETLARPPVGAENNPGGIDHYMSRDGARAWAAEVHRLLGSWGALTDGGLSAATLAGAYPFRYFGQPAGNNTYCTDDLLGRDGLGIRVAAVGRLSGDAARSAYQAASALFLQPEAALMFNTYNPDSKSEFGRYRMAAGAERLRARLTVDLTQGGEANIEAFRARVGPWNRWPLVLMNSSGYPTAWSIGGGDGTTDDFPVGDPCAIHIVHSGSAAEPYDSDTLAGRALWGGAYVYVGSISEPYLSAFQRPDYIAPRLAAGAPFIATCRRRLGQASAGPWRLIAFGDPLFCVRRKPAQRVSAAAVLVDAAETGVALPAQGVTDGSDTKHSLEQLRSARWLGDRAAALASVRSITDPAALDGPGLGMALEELAIADAATEAATLWASASPSAQEHYAARVYARASIARSMDAALAADDSAAAMSACERLFTTKPPENFVARWLDKIGASAKRTKTLPALRAWLAQRIADEATAAWRQTLAATSARAIADELAAKDTWKESERADALTAIATVPFSLEEPQRFTGLVGELIEACAAKSAPALDDFLDQALERFPAPNPQRAIIEQARTDLAKRRTFFKDWLILGPLALDAAQARWESVAPEGKLSIGDAWTRPFTAAAYGVVDLAALLGQKADVCAFAACTVEVELDVQGFLLIGSDDGVTAWLDGKEIWRNPAMRGVQPDQDQVAITLAKGAHTLVLRVDQGGGGWGLCARVAADRAGAPLPGVRLRCPDRAASDPR